MLAFDPTGIEQELMLYVNRMRTDPQGEYDRLIETTSPLKARDAEVQNALTFFHVDGPTLRAQWNALTPVAPLAWNALLYNAAHTHNSAMIAQRSQQHVLPGESDVGQRLTNAGYVWSEYGENIFAYSESPLYAHAGFAIDWGTGPGGLQSPAGHRTNIMSGAHREAGVAIDPFSQAGVDFGPLVVTQDFAARSTIGNSFVVGAVWNDTNDSGWYEAGEGQGGVTIEFTKTGSAPVQVTSMTAGGYQAQLANGTWHARAFGGGLAAPIDVGNVTVASVNKMVNFIAMNNTPPQALPDRAITLMNTPVTINVRGNDLDADGDVATATIEVFNNTLLSVVTVDQTAGTITYVPPADVTGNLEFQYQLRDSHGALSPMTKVTIGVVDPARSWTSPSNPYDSNFDGQVTAIDAVLIINELNATGPRSLIARTSNFDRFLDASGDNFLSPLDALKVITYLNSGAGGFEAQGEAPAVGDRVIAAAEPTLFDLAAWWWLEDRSTEPKAAASATDA
jgi:hypothetical protein